jgi:5'-3' exonuclease
MSEELVILVDGKNVAYRMHFSHIGLRNSQGEPTGMLHGFLYNLLRLHSVEPNARFVFCWDGESPTWRHTLQPRYKANRKINPELPNMLAQLAILEPMLDTLGFHTIKIKGVECDDLMGLLAKKLVEDGKEVRLYSMDSDLYQLLTMKGVTVWERSDSKPITALDVEKKKGITAKDWVRVASMAGGHNNLHGLWKIGPIKAKELWAAGARPDKAWVEQSPEMKILLSRHRSDWERIQQEYYMATIVTDVEAEVWTEEQKEALKKAVRDVVQHPERKVRHTKEMERSFFSFLGIYELKELFEDRSEFWKMP